MMMQSDAGGQSGGRMVETVQDRLSELEVLPHQTRLLGQQRAVGEQDGIAVMKKMPNLTG
jgi:hypothetical protein